MGLVVLGLLVRAVRGPCVGARRVLTLALPELLLERLPGVGRLRLGAHGNATLEGTMQLRAGLPGRPRGLQVQLQWAVRTRLTGHEEPELIVKLAQNRSFSMFMFVGGYVHVVGVEK